MEKIKTVFKCDNKVNVLCPICDTQDYKVMYTPWCDVKEPEKLYGAASGIRGTQTIVKCLNCGMIYENPRFPDEIILQSYISSNESEHDSQYSLRVKSFYQALKSLSSHLPPKGARVLDVGTAGGAFLEAAAQYGYEAIGLEPSHYLVNEGKKRGLNIKQGTIDNHSFEKDSFEMICFWDVLEHLCNPKDSLRKIKPLLKQNGILLINYPDIGTTLAKIAGRKFWWLLSVHLHYFTRETIKKICERAGFEVFYFQRYWQILQFGYLEEMAIRFNIPLSKTIKKFTPSFIQKLSIPYYASQITALARIKEI